MASYPWCNIHEGVSPELIYLWLICLIVSAYLVRCVWGNVVAVPHEHHEPLNHGYSTLVVSGQRRTGCPCWVYGASSAEAYDVVIIWRVNYSGDLFKTSCVCGEKRRERACFFLRKNFMCVRKFPTNGHVRGEGISRRIGRNLCAKVCMWETMYRVLKFVYI